MKPQPKPQRWQSKKYRDAAKDQECTMRLPCCNHNTETTVLAHRGGAGMAMKADDHDSADVCSSCHSIFDGVWPYPDIKKEEEFNRSRLETIINRLERKILK